MNKILPVANGVALIITILINYLSNTGLFHGNTMKTISDKYFNYFTPSGYAFSIWGLIYLGLLGFVLYTGRSVFTKKEEEPVVLKIGWWFVLTCIVNSFWVIAWLNDYIGLSVFIMIVLLLSLLKIVINTRMELDYHPLKKYVFIFWPFALYSGWISVALIANLAAWLTKINWSGGGISPGIWTIIMICIAGLISIYMIRTRNLREYALVAIWALMAISISNRNNEGPMSIIYTCYAVAIILVVFIAINGLKNRGRTIENM